MPSASDLPATPEVGHPGALSQAWTPFGGQEWTAGSWEETPELVFPQSVQVFDRMRRTESQIGALLRAIRLPITSARWSLDSEGVSDQVTQLVRTELGLRDLGQKGRGRRRRQGIVWTEHLGHALLAVPLGFTAFEQVYELAPPTADQDLVSLSQVAHLRKLGLRHPRTIAEIVVGRDGGLLGIRQHAPGTDQITTGGVLVEGRTTITSSGVSVGGYPTSSGSSLDDVFIPAERLVMYSLEREGADWAGNSILRGSYKNWMLKDVLLRLSAQIVERNGMGVPSMGFDPTQGGNQAEALRMMTAFRAGATAGLVYPANGYSKPELLGVTGTTVDPLPVIAYHDQAMSRSALAMFLDLGHDAGARALGDTFVSYFKQSLDAVADWIAEVATEHIIRDLVELNYGPDEPYPVMTVDPITDRSLPSATDLKALVDARILTPDDPLEEDIRQRLSLPGMPQNMPFDPAPIEINPADPVPPALAASTRARRGRKPVSSADDLLAEMSELMTRLATLRSPRDHD